MSRRFLFAAALAVAGAMLAPATSQAAFSVTLSQTGGPTTTVNDRDTPYTLGDPPPTNGTIFDSNTDEPNGGPTGAGQIVLTQYPTPTSFLPTTTVKFGDFTITFAASRTSNGTLSNVLGSTATGISVTNLGTETRTLTITITENAFSLPSGPALTTVTDAFTSLVVNNGTVLGSTTAFNNTGSANTTTVNAGQTAFFARNGGTYTVTKTFVITLGSFGTTTFQGQGIVATVPTPSALILLAGAVPFVGLLRRWRKKPAAEVEAAPVAA